MKKNNKLQYTLITGMGLLLSACGGGNESSTTTDGQLTAVITDKGVTGDPTTGRTLPSITDVKAQLGMKLFFTKGLGGDQDSACVTCHHPKLGGGDDLSLPIGVGAESPDLLGPGRRHSSVKDHYDGGPTVPRNAPTTFNLALWDQFLFHDGRIESLTKTVGTNGAGGGIRTPDSAFNTADADAGANLSEAQARFPVTSPEEMRGFTFEAGTGNAAARTHLENRLQEVVSELPKNEWLAEFRTGFNDPTGTAAALITYPNIANAIGEYERSQIFVKNSWKAYVDGNKSAISEDAKKGALLFYNTVAKGGANCASCHKGDFFTDEQFHVVAMPQIGRGKGNDNGTYSNDDFGRFRETGVPEDKYAFRTPTLLNVEETGPWGHAGAYTSLEAVVRHHLNPQQAIENYDFNQIDPTINASAMKFNTQLAMDTLKQNRTDELISPILEDVTLSDTQVNQLVAFLKALTDPCVKTDSCISAWVPDASDTNPDLLRVNALDSNGLPL